MSELATLHTNLPGTQSRDGNMATATTVHFTVHSAVVHMLLLSYMRATLPADYYPSANFARHCCPICAAAGIHTRALNINKPTISSPVPYMNPGPRCACCRYGSGSVNASTVIGTKQLIVRPVATAPDDRTRYMAATLNATLTQMYSIGSSGAPEQSAPQSGLPPIKQSVPALR